MKVYFLKLGKSCKLKIDMVQDYVENLKPIKKGMHSLDDIYYRKIFAAIGAYVKEDAIGRVIPTGRQTAKDLFDIYYLSKEHKPLSKFFLEYFTYDKAEPFFVWYRSFDRTSLRSDLIDLSSFSMKYFTKSGMSSFLSLRGGKLI